MAGEILRIQASPEPNTLRSRSILSRQRHLPFLVLLELSGQAEKTSYQIFVLSLQLGILNLTRFLAKHFSPPFTLGARFHGFR